MANYRLVCTLHIPYDEWENVFTENIIFSSDSTNSRTARPRKLRCGFHDYLTRITQSNGLNCWFKCIMNSYKVSESTWSGSFRCFDHGCTVKYMFQSDKIVPNEVVNIHLFSTGEARHTEPVVIDVNKRSLIKDTRENRTVTVRSKPKPVSLDDDTRKSKRIRSNQREEETVENLSLTREKNRRGLNQTMNENEVDEPFCDIGNQVSPILWAKNEVYEFVTRLAGAEVANSFRAHEIDGKALEYLKIETMCQVLKLKLGCAARIKRTFDQLKKKSQE